MTNNERVLREALEQIATMPLSKEFELNERGEIKHGSNSYGPSWAAWHFQQKARATLASTADDTSNVDWDLLAEKRLGQS